MFGRLTLQAHPQDEKGSFMRILVALIAVFMVSGAVAQKKPVGSAPVDFVGAVSS